MKRLLIVVNVDWFFISHRLPVAIAALNAGFETHIATTLTSPDRRIQLVDLGLHVHELKFDRSASSLIRLCQSFFAFLTIYLNVKPDILHLVTLQPVLIGGMVSRLLSAKSVLFAISGLGTVFSGTNLKSKLLRWLTLSFYKVAFGVSNKIVVFQNQSDLNLLQHSLHLSYSDLRVFKGSGVDVSIYSPPKDFPPPTPTILMASRLLVPKGVLDFVEASKIVSSFYPNARFLLAGSTDPSNPSSLTQDQLDEIISLPTIQYLGQRHDLHSVMKQCSIFVLPSYYPEGLPRVICEAMSCGLPVITTSTPGCKDAVQHKSTGLLVPPKDHVSLSQAILHLLSTPSTLLAMSKQARAYAIAHYDINLICQQHLEAYRQLLDKSRPPS